MRFPLRRQPLVATAFAPAAAPARWLYTALTVACITGLIMAISPATALAAEPTPAATSTYEAFSDSAAIPDEAAAREALESLRYQLGFDPEQATSPAPSATPASAGGSQLPPALAAQMRTLRDQSIAQIQKQIAETDPVKDAESRKLLEDALAKTKASYAQMLGEAAPAGAVASAPTPVASTSTTAAAAELKIPAIGNRQLTLSEAIANLKKMLRDNSPAAAITAFEKSEDYADATRASASAAAAIVVKRPMAALAGLLRAHELEPKKPAHLINLAGLTASFAMPRHTLALLEAAEKLLPSAGVSGNDLGGLKARAVLLTNRGRALVQLKRFDQAETALREAVRLEPNLSEARINLAHALYQQSDKKKEEEAIYTMRFARVRLATRTPTAPATPPPPAPTSPPPGETKAPGTPTEESEAERVAERHGRRPAHDLFDLSIGKKGHLPTIKIPRKIADGHAMWKKIHTLHEETIARMSSTGTRMNQLWDIMTKRERSGEMSRLSGRRAQDIFWYISNADSEPELRGRFNEFTKASRDPGNGTFGGQITNPFGSQELEKEMDAIMARDQPWAITVQQLYDAIEPYHSTWQGPIHDFETDTHRLAEAYYKHATAIAAHLSDPVHHEYANLLIRSRVLGYFSEYITALETVARWDYDNIEAWHVSRGSGEAEDPTDGDYPESDWCPAALKGEYKVKASIKIFEVSVNCEKIGVGVSAGHWVKAFAEIESTWEGDKSIFIGAGVEAAVPGAGPSAESKSGFFINVDAKGEITDFGLKSSQSVGVNVGPVGYEREVESTFSLMSVLSSPST